VGAVVWYRSSYSIKELEELLRWSGLENYRDIVVGKFSKGMKRKLDLCVGLLNLPALLIL